MSDHPFGVLGLQSSCTAEQVRAARKRLALEHHPDVGGDAAQMQRVNSAAAAALKLLATDEIEPVAEQQDWIPTMRDVPSFTVEALPAETFEALLLATKHLGEVEDDDPPYELRTLLWHPLECWCQLNVVPDAGASTVSISIAATEEHPLPSIVAVRNAWINALNELDWSAL